MANKDDTKMAPRGMEPFDVAKDGSLGALSGQQQQELNGFKVLNMYSKYFKQISGQIDSDHRQKMKTRLENEQYLRKHPEIECLLAGFLRDVLTQRPTNVREFAADHFTRSDLPSVIEQQLEDRQHKLQQNKVLKNM